MFQEENSERNSLATPAENSHQSATHLVNEIAPQQQDETPETLPNSTSEDQKSSSALSITLTLIL